jgi:hypothetical protein
MNIVKENDEVMQFVKQHADNPLKMELLVFWSRYPNTRFSLGTISCALNRNRRGEVQRALESLAEIGFVDKHIHMGSPCYSLTSEHQKRQPIISLSKYSWRDLRYCLELQEVEPHHPFLKK